jgi:inorganic pyrophosphatase/exopolyphosphatase
MNTNPSTFRLRTEIRWFLKENFSNVIFINDINLNELYDQKKLEIILVDHHYLHSQLNAVVVEIIDHHQIKKDAIILQEYEEIISFQKKTIRFLISSSVIKIEPVGSCCTLIADKLLSSSFEMTEEVVYLLTGKIINERNENLIVEVFSRTNFI